MFNTLPEVEEALEETGRNAAICLSLMENARRRHDAANFQSLHAQRKGFLQTKAALIRRRNELIAIAEAEYTPPDPSI